jgi:hypothetical protein
LPAGSGVSAVMVRAASIVGDASKSWRVMPGFAPGIHG